MTSAIVANTQRTGGRAQPGPRPHGLVVKVTSNTRTHRHGTNDWNRADCYRGLNRQRRVRRMRRVVIRSAEAAREGIERGGGRHAATFITLTYRDGVLWSPRHVSEFIRRLRQWCRRRGVVIRYQWVLELTKRGIPHYHVLLWLPKRVHVPMPDKSGWWVQGLSRVERVVRSAVGYLVKYVSKGLEDSASGEIPKGGRLFGCSNAGDENHQVRRARLPVWLERCTEEAQLPKRIAFVGFVCKQTGEIYRSPYKLDVCRASDGRYVICFLEEIRC